MRSTKLVAVLEEKWREKKKTGCKIICGAPATLAVKGLMMKMNDGETRGFTVYRRFRCSYRPFAIADRRRGLMGQRAAPECSESCSSWFDLL